MSTDSISDSIFRMPDHIRCDLLEDVRVPKVPRHPGSLHGRVEVDPVRILSQGQRDAGVHVGHSIPPAAPVIQHGG